MLAGELPWERAHDDSASFAAWSLGRATTGARPWNKLRAGALALLRRALHPAPASRPALGQLLDHPWLAEDEVDGKIESPWRGYCSQPAAAAVTEAPEDEHGPSAADVSALLSLSQPAAADDVLLATQERHTQSSQSVMQRLVRRMTRVWVRTDEAGALRELEAALRRLPAPAAAVTLVHPRIMAIECGSGLKFRAWALRAGHSGSEARVLLDFRRSRGCGLAFKRKFSEIRRELRHVEAAPPAWRGDLVAPPIDSQPEPMDQA